MENHERKAHEFIVRLMSNPNLRSLPPLQKEDRILNFLDMNRRILYPTLSSSNFFYQASWTAIFNLLYQQLSEICNAAAEEQLKEIIFRRTDFTFLSLLPDGSRNVRNQDTFREQFLSYMKKVLEHRPCRDELSGSLTALHTQMPERYIESIFDGKSYIRFEITNVQRLKMGKEEIKHFVKTAILMRAAVSLYAVGSRRHGVTGLIPEQFAVKCMENMKKELPFFPDSSLKSGMLSNCSAQEQQILPAIARIAMVLGALGKAFRPDLAVDRGAAGQEQSWFGIARKNYKYYGYDGKMVDELYRIAAENNW